MSQRSIVIFLLLSCILTAPVLPIGAQDPQRPDTIKLNTSLVSVPVVVKDRANRFVTGLAERDFIVEEDGVRQEIAEFSSAEAPMSVVLLLDASLSTKDWVESIRDTAREFADQLTAKDKVMVVAFDAKVHFLSDFLSDRSQIRRAIRARNLKGDKKEIGTALFDAVQAAVVEKLTPVKGRKAMVVFSDGIDTASRRATLASAKEMVANLGVPAYTIQYPGIRSDYGFLDDLSKLTGALHFSAESVDNADSAFSSIAEELRFQYTLVYYSKNERRDGQQRRITVRVNRPDVSLRAREAYRAPKD
jgi:Ca-activated chloride channel homolog